MAFDKTQPTDTTKIRNLGTVIRPNWVAIEEGGSTFKPYATNYQTRTDLGVSNDPSAISGASIAYCKDDADGNAELYAINENSDVVQLTRGGINIAASGHTVLPGGLILNWGTATGTSANVTFDRAFTSSAYSITVTSLNSDANATATVSALSTTGATLKSTNVNALYYMAIGF